METRRLYRSEQDRLVAGVCAGLATYFGLDPVLVRIAFVALALLGGAGVWLYLAMWLIVPRESRLDAPPDEVARDGIADMRDRLREGVEAGKQALGRSGASSPASPAPPPAPPPGDPGTEPDSGGSPAAAPEAFPRPAPEPDGPGDADAVPEARRPDDASDER